MQTLSVSRARPNLHHLIEQTVASHQPITITSKNSNAILLSESDWSAIQETLYLNSIPQMRESIQAGLVAPNSEFSKELNW